MRQNIKLSIKILVLSLLAIMTSCIDDVKSHESSVVADDNAITLSLFTENEKIATRSGLSDGTTVNRLYYSIYKKEENGNYVVDTYYHNDKKKYKEFKFEAEDRKNFTIKLLPDPGANPNQEYKIVCWAQYTEEKINGENISYESPYYDISEFPNITVKYDKDNEGNNVIGLNNDEYRDAFYASKKFEASQKGQVINVELYRPFAQINIGTSGWDYEGLATIEPNPQIVKYSKITVKGVADQLDLLNNRATATGNKKDLTAEYEYAVIPAYRNLIEGWSQWGKKIKGVYADDKANVQADSENEIEEKIGVYTKAGVDEEFLKISFPENERPDNPQGDFNLDSFDKNKDGFADYIGWKKYAAYCDESGSHENLLYNIYTETFKYLSMCYVLVPFQTSDASVDSIIEPTEDSSLDYGSTVEIEFDCAEADENGSCKETGILGAGKNVIELKNVPVARNYRTNIIAADGTGFFMNSNELNVAIYPEPFADYYRRLGATDKDWNDKGPEGDEDRNGDNLNGEYGWQDDDIENEEAWKTPIVLPGLLNLNNDPNIDITNKKIDCIKYFEREINIIIDPLAGEERYSELSKYLNLENLNYKFYLEDSEIDEKKVEKRSEGNYQISLKVSELNQFIIDHPRNSVTLSSQYDYERNRYENDQLVDDRKQLPDIKYYPIKFRVVTIFGDNNNKFKSEDLVITIRLMATCKFTFSNNSEDGGRDIMDLINSSGTLANPETREIAEDEIGLYYLSDAQEVEANNVKLVSRDNDPDIEDKNKNDRVFAFPDHIRIKGAGTEDNHHIILENLLSNCNIIAKIGRDFGQDNNRDNDIYNRSLYVDWDDDFKSQEWKGYNNDSDKITSGPGTQTYKNTESRIMPEMTTRFNTSSPHDVKLYVTASGHAFYWIILSEPED